VILYLLGHTEIITLTWFHWLSQGKPHKQWWVLWREAIAKAIP